jgi:hypothetical protein
LAGAFLALAIVNKAGSLTSLMALLMAFCVHTSKTLRAARSALLDEWKGRHTASAATRMRLQSVLAPDVLDTLRSPYLTFTCKASGPSDAKDTVARLRVRAAKIVAAKMRETLVEVFIVVGAIERNGEPRLSKILLDGSPPQPMAAEYSLNPVWSPGGKYLVYSGSDVGMRFPLRASAPDGRPFGMASLILTRGARRVAFAPDTGSLVILRGEIAQEFLAVESTDRRRASAYRPAIKLRHWRFRRVAGRNRNHF